MFIPSKYNLNIFNTYKTTRNNIVVDAVPGSGKTTQILKLLDITPPYYDVCFLAFNVDIVEELKSKIPSTNKKVKVSTIHGIGMSVLFQNHVSKLKVSEYKSYILFKDLAKQKGWKFAKNKEDISSFINSDLYNLYRILDLQSVQELEPAAERYGIDYSKQNIERFDDFLEYINIYNNIDVKGKSKMVDFTDMIYIPVKKKWNIKQYDELFIDECQDLNKLQQKFVQKMIKPTGRFVAVGDKYQCIYSFAGADPESFNNFLAKPNTIQLPLSVSYRCSKLIINKANGIYNNIESLPEAPHGEVRDGSIEEVKSGDFVLCRNNSPLIELYIELLKKGKKSFIRGKDLGTNLIYLIKGLGQYQDKKEYFAEIIHNLIEELKNRGFDSPHKHPRYRALNEKITILNILFNEHGSVEKVRSELEKMFNDDKQAEGIKLMTIHKSKGLESDKVFILHPSLIPSKYAEQKWEKEQEENLKYVAYTRAKTHLIFINDVELAKEQKN